MKDSQHLHDHLVISNKYINANNERFSTGGEATHPVR